MLIIVFALIAILVITVVVFLQQPSFGKMPSGARLERIKSSPNYRNGEFSNLSHTPMLSGGSGYFTVIWKFLFDKDKNNIPTDSLPSVRTDLSKIDLGKDVLIWFGHSSYFMQIDGKKILVDPVFSGHASPVTFTTKSFEGADIYSVDDIPDIDYLLITHDHWDHLDYQTVTRLRPRVKKVITGLGVGAHLEYWGFADSVIEERDWNEEIILEPGFSVNTAPARHFSGRGLKRNGSLWMSFIVTTPSKKIYIGGDSGFDSHFLQIGNKFGPFDLAILENGQYNLHWKYIHMMPEETVQAARDLRAKRLMPVHWSKFPLALHAWDEPMKRIIGAAESKKMPLLHPMIGEEINLDDMGVSTRWWEKVH